MLTDVECRAAVPREKLYKLSDQHGLYLLVEPNGRKYWRYDYRFFDKRKTLALGIYPEVGLAEARDGHIDARRLLRADRDPSLEKRIARRGTSFESIAREWFKIMASQWEKEQQDHVLRSFERDVFPALGARPIASIRPPDILDVLRKIENRGAHTTCRRTRQRISGVFCYALAGGLVPSDPAATLGSALVPRPRVRHRARIEEGELPEFMRRLDSYNTERTRLAVELTLLTLLRTAEIRYGKWSEIKGETWRIPAERMKLPREHLVPLARRTIEVLARLKELSWGSEWMFPAPTKTGVMSENAMLELIYTTGYYGRLTIHGFRGIGSTHLNEQGWPSDWIELQLSHVPEGVRARYNAAQHIKGRTEMMAYWASFIESRRAAYRESNNAILGDLV